MSGPKLLDKKVVNAEVATQRKQQIDLGLSLAKKVDAVRDSLGEEQTKLEEFRTNTIARVQVEIDGYVRQKDSLIQEIRDRQEQLRLLQIPLDTKWEELGKAQAVCNEWETELEGRQEYIDQEQRQVEQLKVEAELELGRAKDFKHRASEDLVLADTTLADARETAATIRNQAQATLVSAEAKEHEIQLKEEALEGEIMYVKSERDRLLPWESDLVKREKKLKAGWETFLKSQNYLKNKN